MDFIMKMSPTLKSIFWWTLAATAYFFVYAVNLGFPEKPYFDEIYQAQSALNLMHHEAYYSTHPPLGIFLMMLSMKIFGEHAWAWRLVSLVSGFGCLFFVHRLTWRLSGSARTAFFAAFLFFFEALSFTQARVALLNAPMLCLMLISAYFFLRHAYLGEWERGSAFFLSGLFFGLALATRWVALGVAAIFLIFAKKLWYEERNKMSLVKDIFLYFIATPLLVYLGIFSILPILKVCPWSWVFGFQKQMVDYNLHLKAGHLYGSEWWTWPFMIRPIWYFFERNQAGIQGILAIGNPAIFWAIPAAIGYVIYSQFKKASYLGWVLLVGFFTQWLQWAFVSRVKFFHYYYTAIPFAVMALALALESLWKQGVWGRWIVTASLLGVAGLFFYWYPLLNGLSCSEAFYQAHLWLETWV